LLTIRLDARMRFKLAGPQPAGDLQYPPKNHLMALFIDDDAREEVREIIADAFGLHFVINPLGMTELRIQMFNDRPANFQKEKSLDREAQGFFKDAIDISQFSDGVRAFAGLVTFLMSSDYRIIMIDEPELCLHPPLAHKLGRVIADLALERGGNVLASTHSADFLMGCIQSGRDINVVRLTYTEGTATARLLPSESLQEMMKDPLMRSTGVLSALFHKGCVVTEADADRALYQEINERLLASNLGIDSCVFLNAQNKQTVQRIVSPLRKMGIPAAAIVDLDVLKGTSTLKELLKSCTVPQSLVQGKRSRSQQARHRGA
jgi:hypothetical protein